jgi:hypothetical protein
MSYHKLESYREVMSIVLFLMMSSGTAAAQSFEYPLQVGNQWSYRSDARGPASAAWTVEATGLDEFKGRTYTRLEGSPGGTLWLRQARDGKVFAWSPELGDERVWLDFAEHEGVSFPSAVDPCSPQAKIVSYSRTYSGPLGEFTNAALVAYGPNGCADAGLEHEYYLPGLGLLHRTYLTIAGPRSFDLIHARIGGRTYASEPHVSFGLALDRAVYEFDPEDPSPGSDLLTARLTLRNQRPEPLELRFPTGQIYDLTLRNAEGSIVFRWSDGRFFTQAQQAIEVAGARTDVVTLRLARRDRSGKSLAPGLYAAEGWLTTEPGLVFRASLGFEIRHTR